MPERYMADTGDPFDACQSRNLDVVKKMKTFLITVIVEVRNSNLNNITSTMFGFI